MVSGLGLRLSRVFERTAPDPFVLAILLTLVTAALALTLGDFGDAPRAVALLDTWRGPEGLWKFLAFGMQMCLVLVTGHALAASGPVRLLVDRLASLPRSGAAAAAMIALVACIAGLVNWGLGLIVGALLAREVGRALSARGAAAHGPLLAAAGYSGMLVWHGGFSGSAPLAMTTADGASKVLPEQALANFADGVPLSATILSPLNLIATGGLVVLVPLVYFALSPRNPDDCRPLAVTKTGGEKADDLPSSSIPERLNRSRIIAGLLAATMAAAAVRSAAAGGFVRIGLNEINAAMLAAGLVLHGSPRSYVAAAEDGARGCAGIILQFPLYAGIMGMLAESGLLARFADLMSGAGATALPLATAASAAAVNLFVPSGGGQWGIQGPIALEAGLAAGVEPGRMIMAVAYGDQLTNMLQPFWALPLLAITGCKAREIVGFTAVAMAVAAVWLGLCLIVF